MTTRRSLFSIVAGAFVGLMGYKTADAKSSWWSVTDRNTADQLIKRGVDWVAIPRVVDRTEFDGLAETMARRGYSTIANDPDKMWAIYCDVTGKYLGASSTGPACVSWQNGLWRAKDDLKFILSELEIEYDCGSEVEPRYVKIISSQYLPADNPFYLFDAPVLQEGYLGSADIPFTSIRYGVA